MELVSPFPCCSFSFSWGPAFLLCCWNKIGRPGLDTKCMELLLGGLCGGVLGGDDDDEEEVGEAAFFFLSF